MKNVKSFLPKLKLVIDIRIVDKISVLILKQCLIAAGRFNNTEK